MTVQNSTRQAGPFTATAGQTVFPYGFRILAEADLAVYRLRANVLSELALTADYTVSGVNAPSGGSVTLMVGSDAGDILAIVSERLAERVTDLSASAAVTAPLLNAEYDHLILLLQDLRRDASRSLRSRPVDPTIDLSLPPPTPGRLLGWNDFGTGLINRGLAGHLFVWRGDWTAAPGTEYGPGDVVRQSGVAYYCLTAHLPAAISQPGTGTSWQTYWDIAVPTFSVNSTTTSAPGGAASVQLTGNGLSQFFEFVIPRGEAGPPGALAGVTVTTLAQGSPATATISGAYPNQILQIGIPQGTGPAGPAGPIGAAGLSDMAQEAYAGWKYFKWDLDGSTIGSFDADNSFVIGNSGRYRNSVSLTTLGITPVAGKRVYLKFAEVSKSGTFTAFRYSTQTIANGAFTKIGAFWYAVVILQPTDTSITVDIIAGADGLMVMSQPQYAIDGDGVRPSDVVAVEQSRLAIGKGNLLPLVGSAGNSTYADGVWTINANSLATLTLSSLSLASSVPYTVQMVQRNPRSKFRRAFLQAREGANSWNSTDMQHLGAGNIGLRMTPVVPSSPTFSQIIITVDNRNPSVAGVFTSDIMIFDVVKLITGNEFSLTGAAATVVGAYDRAQGHLSQAANAFSIKFKGADNAGTRYLGVNFKRQIDGARTLKTWDIETIKAYSRAGANEFSDNFELVGQGGKSIIWKEAGAGDFMGGEPHRADTIDAPNGYERLIVDGAVVPLDGVTQAIGCIYELHWRHGMFRIAAAPSQVVSGLQLFDIRSSITIDCLNRTVTHRHRGQALQDCTLETAYVAAMNILRYRGSNIASPPVAVTAWAYPNGELDALADIVTFNLAPGFAPQTYPGRPKIVIGGQGFRAEMEALTGYTSANRQIFMNEGGAGASASAKPYFVFYGNGVPTLTFTAGQAFDLSARWRFTMTE